MLPPYRVNVLYTWEKIHLGLFKVEQAPATFCDLHHILLKCICGVTQRLECQQL